MTAQPPQDPAQLAKLPGVVAKAECHAGHSREASTAFSEACTAYLRIMSRIGERFRAFPPRCLALASQCIAMPARYEFADPLTLISARRTLRCRRNGLSRCFAVMSQFESLLPKAEVRLRVLDDGQEADIR